MGACGWVCEVLVIFSSLKRGREMRGGAGRVWAGRSEGCEAADMATRLTGYYCKLVEISVTKVQ